jgi:hypothetical protein
MSVLLTVSETLTGAAYSDSLSGGGSGIDLGSCLNGQYAPIILQSANTGAQHVYVRHNATIDPITDLKMFLQNYGVGTGFTYGGAVSAASDRTRILNQGDASVTTNANNADGLGGGLHIDMDWQVNSTNQFATARIATGQHRIFGDDGGAAAGIGRDLATAIVLHADAMSYNNTGTETDATTPVAGSVGKTGDTVLGDRGHFLMRQLLRTDEVDGGILQVEVVLAYSYTA